MGSPSSIMRAFVLFAVVALAAGAPKISKKALSTPLSRGGGRIVGGTEASPGEFPHQIALLRGGVGGSLMCGGSLVAPDMVVTAGHCCDGQSASRLGVRVGNHHLYEDDPDQMDIAVSKVMLHEDYDSWTIENDICLLELEGQADFSSSVIGSISLPSSMEEYPAGTQCSVPVLSKEARTPAKETLVAHSCAEANFPVLSLGDMDVLSPATLVSTLRPPTSSAGLTLICKNCSKPFEIWHKIL